MNSRIERTDRRASRVGAALLSIALSSAPMVTHAQDSTSASPAAATREVRSGWIVGGLVGMPGFGAEPLPELMTLGLSATHLVPNRPGLDVALSALPRGFMEGVLVLHGRLGIALPVTLGRNAFLIPSGGVSAIGGMGGGDAGGIAGYYGSVATVLATGSVGFRAGVALHRFAGLDGAVWHVELGVMHVPLPHVPGAP